MDQFWPVLSQMLSLLMKNDEIQYWWVKPIPKPENWHFLSFTGMYLFSDSKTLIFLEIAAGFQMVSAWQDSNDFWSSFELRRQDGGFELQNLDIVYEKCWNPHSDAFGCCLRQLKPHDVESHSVFVSKWTWIAHGLSVTGLLWFLTQSWTPERHLDLWACIIDSLVDSPIECV